MKNPITMRSSNELTQMTTEELRQELGKAITVTAESLHYMGLVWRELEYRGEDLSSLRQGIGAYLPLIASGRLRAEIVVRYAGKSMLLKKMSELPLDEQDALLQDENIHVIETDKDGIKVNTVNLSQIRTDQIRTVFGPTGIRSLEQQKKIVEYSNSKNKSSRKRDAIINISNDGTLHFGKRHVTVMGEVIHISQIVEAIRAAYGIEVVIPDQSKSR